MKLIDVSTPKYPNTFVKVDDEDFDDLSKEKWYPFRPPGGGLYAVKNIGYGRGNRTIVLMHRHILCAVKGTTVDHKNGDSLDNQKGNLRFCTLRENARNSKKRAATSSKFKGVCFLKNKNRYRAYIKVDGRMKHLGTFISEVDAAVAYDKAALTNFGEFAKLNFGSNV